MVVFFVIASVILSVTTANTVTHKEYLELNSFPRTSPQYQLQYFKFEFESSLSSGSDAEIGANLKTFPFLLTEILNKSNAHVAELTHTQGNFPSQDADTLISMNVPYAAPPGTSLYTDGDADWDLLANMVSDYFLPSTHLMTHKSKHTRYTNFRSPFSREQVYPEVIFGFLNNQDVCSEHLLQFKKLLPCRDTEGVAVYLDYEAFTAAFYQSYNIRFEKTPLGYSYKMIIQAVLRSSDVTSFLNRYYKAHGAWPITDLAACMFCSSSIIKKMGDGEVEYWMDLKTRNPIDKSTNKNENQDDSLLPYIQSQRYVTGKSTEEYGQFTHRITNNHPSQAVKIRATEFIPWFLRCLYHTLSISTTPSTHQISTDISSNQVMWSTEVEAGSSTTFVMTCERRLLSFQEFPKDPYRGFDTLPGFYEVKRVEDDNVAGGYFGLSQAFLVMLTEPDFSMPLNVSVLAWSVVTFGVTSFVLMALRSRKGWETEIGVQREN